jgi:hypothetical protein
MQRRHYIYIEHFVPVLVEIGDDSPPGFTTPTGDHDAPHNKPPEIDTPSYAAENAAPLVRRLDTSGFVKQTDSMKPIKVSSKVDEQVWNDLKAMAEESHQSISGLLTDAISEYLQRRRIRPEVLQHAHDSIAANDELVRRLAE